MTRTTHTTANAFQPASAPQPNLQALLSQSEDGFYGSLQRIWNNVVQLDDRSIIQQESETFMYAYRFAEAELQRVHAQTDFVAVDPLKR